MKKKVNIVFSHSSACIVISVVTCILWCLLTGHTKNCLLIAAPSFLCAFFMEVKSARIPSHGIGVSYFVLASCNALLAHLYIGMPLVTSMIPAIPPLTMFFWWAVWFEEHADEESAVQESAVQESAAEQTAAEQTAAEQAPAEQATAEQAAAEQAATAKKTLMLHRIGTVAGIAATAAFTAAVILWFEKNNNKE